MEKTNGSRPDDSAQTRKQFAAASIDGHRVTREAEQRGQGSVSRQWKLVYDAPPPVTLCPVDRGQGSVPSLTKDYVTTRYADNVMQRAVLSRQYITQTATSLRSVPS